MAQQLQNILADEARADGLHDFGPLGPSRTADRTEAFDTSVIPGISGQNWTDEDVALNSVFVGVGVNIRATLAGLADNAVVDSPTTITGHRYRIKRVAFIGGEAAKKDGPTLAEQIELNGSVLQVDFNHHGFLSRLKTGPDRPEIQVGYIWSAATVNDPASKTPPHDSIFEPGGGGVNLTVHVQTSGATPFPGRQPYDAAAPTKNFISAYDLELSGITKKVSFGRRVKDIVTLKFTDPPTKRNAMISDSKGQNSPAQLNGFITKLLANLGNAKAMFELSTKWQQKRSGDWLQAIIAAILKTMKFVPPLPPGFHTFFMSHDRIAIAYALSIGLSCLYFSGDSIYVFDNRPEDPNAATSRCVDGLTAIPNARKKELVRWFFGQDLPGGHTAGMNDIRNQKLSEFDGLVRTKCSQLIGTPGSPPIASLGELERTIKDALTAALKSVFIEKSFPDAGTIRTGLSSDDPCAQYKSYATLSSLFNQHNGGINIPPTFFGQFERTMVFKTLSDWKIEPSSSVPSRLMNFIRQQGEQADARDSFAFFPFIQNSESADLKETIANTFQSVLNSLTDEKLEALGARTPSRKSRAMLGLTNLLKQGLIYLKSSFIPDEGVAPLAGEFVTLMNMPGVPASEEADVDGDVANFGAVVNRITPKEAVRSKLSKQEVPDSSPDELAGGGQTGGWEAGNPRLIVGTEIDFDQCADPLVYAIIEYFYYVGQGTEASAIQTAIRGGGRRPLYGGGNRTVTQTMTETIARSPTDSMPADILNLSMLEIAAVVSRDSWKLDGAPMDVISYYAKVSSLVSALVDVEPTWLNARAVYALTTYGAYIKDADFAAALSVDTAKDDPRIYRLQFSAMQENPPIHRPTEPAKDLLAGREMLSRVWKSLPPTTGATPQSIRISAETTIRKIGERYGIAPTTYPGMGVPLAPGVEILTNPEVVRAARIRALRENVTNPYGPPPA